MAEMVTPFHITPFHMGEDFMGEDFTENSVNSCSLVGDDHDTVQKCAGAVYEQFMQHKTIKHPLSGKEIKIVW